ncbi:MAG: 5-(carboxyamino)imidazole ribonucleotide synthase, partial [Myxococcales bacterium]|nr:5-(carboxyamino)imidazole ribonucleotide synthase [Myxococcales bacterium]
MTALLPGATIGILGGGQLAQMMTLEAKRMGYRVAVLDPNPDASASVLADFAVQGRLDDLEAAHQVARVSDIITLDTEHIPAAILSELETLVPVQPTSATMAIVQDRLAQRRFLAERGLPQTAFAAFDDEHSLVTASQRVGFPCIMKTRFSGYDGKGQVRIGDENELVGAWERLKRQPALLEAVVDFRCEISVVLGRDARGTVARFPIAENLHKNHILHTTIAPARVTEKETKQAAQIAVDTATALHYVGVMAVEMFLTSDGQTLVNEIAPRTHNSGHFTYGACATSQFEQHI